MYRSGIEMRVLINGRPVREYSQKGMTFIESRHGSNYSIKIKNDGGIRVMAVVSVDGLDVITGKPAENTNKGYIVDAYSSTEIKGYRLSDAETAAFVFVSKDKSFVATAEQGDKRNSGVIGIRVFEEKPEKVKVIEKHIHHNHYPVHPWNPYPIAPAPVYPYWYSLGASGNCSLNNVTSYTVSVSNSTSNGVGSQSTQGNAQSVNCDLSLSSGGTVGTTKNNFDTAIQSNNFDTGTGWGDKQTDKVKKEYFRKGKILGELVLYYASSTALIDMGIDLDTMPIVAEVKKKLPAAFGNSEYCQPPKGWVG